ncbi:MAG: GHKL domain-containing protein [Firmicutes bacterium]|nr:GHKL domain-containing protein [Bacillota bacterium]
MTKNYYKAASIIYALQLILLTVLINNMFMSRFNVFQSSNLENMEMFLSISVFFLNIAAVFVIRHLHLDSKRAHRLEIESLKFKHIEEQNHLYRQHRHDLKNHLSIISGLAQTNGMESLKNYLSSYLDVIDKSIVTVDTGLKELDTLLYAKFTEAKRKNISIDYKCLTGLECGQKHIIELAAVLANVLDNAIEACENVKGSRSITMQISSDAFDYIFTVTNTCDAGMDPEKKLLKEGYTSKKGSTRGEGLSIIKRTVKNLRGEIGYKVKEERFHLKIEIPIYKLVE